VKFSDRPPVRAGSDAVWDQAEGALKSAAKAAGLDVILNPGEGAFYGPKLEFVLRDAIGRDWQCGTLQVDFVVPGRLGAEYVAEDGSRKTPVMLHRAIFGSFERIIGVLIEHHAGRFPLWMAPTQAVVATIVNDADSYAEEVAAKLRAAGMRVDTDLSNEKINAKVREHSVAHVPLILAVGRRDMESKTVSVRRLGSEKQEVLELGAAVTTLSKEAQPPF
jgi:threonyl-tRNA synthetase